MELEKSLPFNLQFFASDSAGGDDSQTDSTETKGEDTSDGKEKADKKADSNSDEHMIPKSRFDEVNDNFKSMKAELDNMKKEQADADAERQKKEKDDAEKRGEFENLYNDAKSDIDSLEAEKKTAGERVEALEGVIQGLLDSKLENIDKDYHDLIPDGMTPEQKLSWVNSAEEKGIFGGKKVNEPLGKQTNPTDSQTVDSDKMNPMQKMLSGYGK